MIFSEQSVTATKEILYNDHFVGIPYTVSDSGITANSDGEKIVPAGTILPANDATAQGILLSDTDVTAGPRSATIVVHGFIKNGAIPAAPAAEAKTALKDIQFIG